MNRPADTTRLDDAARAGWLYYVAGNTQDQIAAKLGISRQTAQRLVSLGAAALFEDAATPQDGIEPVRRMCKWIVEQTSDGDGLVALARSGI